MSLNNKITEVKNQLEKDLKETAETGEYDAFYLQYFSKTHGLITKLIKELPEQPAKERKELGPLINQLKIEAEGKIKSAQKAWKKHQLDNPLLDLTLPSPTPDPKPRSTGYLHPTTQVIREMNEFFRYYGFSVVEGPEIETAEYNFRKLNLPEEHPATDLQDTLFVNEPNILLRTQTSSVETRILTDYKPPIRVAFPGKVYRNETANKTNSAFFHHYQGVVVDKGITIQHLKHTLTLFHQFLFGEDVELRFRYKYYPEVSPGMGVDMRCKFCGGSGCEVCKFRGWIEVLGSGMIHYNTLKMCGIDPDVYTGFAFGMGLDRLVMQKFGVDDIRRLYGGGVVYV